MIRVFVSTCAADKPPGLTIIAALKGVGWTVGHSPIEGDVRWRGWYESGLDAELAEADVFVAVVDQVWDSSTWMAEECHRATRSELPMFYWNPTGVEVTAAGMLSYLNTCLPNELADLLVAIEGALGKSGR